MEIWVPCSQDIIARELEKKKGRGEKDGESQETHSKHKIKAEKSKCFFWKIKTGILQDMKLDTWWIMYF